MADAVQLFEPAVPAHDPIVAVDDREPVVQRLQDVLAELAQPLELVGLDPKLAVQAAVLERRRGLRRDRGEQRHVFAAERLGAGLSSERHDRDGRLPSRRTERSSGSRLAPELDSVGVEATLRQRIVERSVWPAVSRAPTSDDRGSEGWRRRRSRSARSARNRRPSGGRRRQHQRHAIDDERLDDAVHEPLAEAQQVEVAVQVAREADERAPVVVAVAVDTRDRARSGWRS